MGHGGRCKCDGCRAKQRERDRRWRERNAEHARQVDRDKAARWRARHPEKAIATVRAWEQRNPDKVRQWARERYYRVKAKPFHHHRRNILDKTRRHRPTTVLDLALTAEALEARWAFYGGRCWMCGEEAEHFDHVLPLAKGGTNWPSNLRPACMDCNRRKYTKHHAQL